MRRLIAVMCTTLQTALAGLQALQRRLPPLPAGEGEPADHGTAFGLDATLTATSQGTDERRR